MNNGKLAIVETTLPDGSTVMAIEVAMGRQVITIDNQHRPLPNDVREIAQQLLEKVRTTYGNRS